MAITTAVDISSPFTSPIYPNLPSPTLVNATAAWREDPRSAYHTDNRSTFFTKSAVWLYERASRVAIFFPTGPGRRLTVAR